jgi:integrase
MSEPTGKLVRYRKIWCIAWSVDRRTKRRSLGTRDRTLAETRYQAYLAESKRTTRPTRVTVADCLAGYLEATPAVEGRKALSWFGPKLPEHIDRAACDDYTALRTADGIRPKTIHTELGMLRSALIWAEREGWLTKAPYIHRPDPGAPRDRWLSREEADRLKAGCRMPHVRLFVEVALATGARPGAVLDLTWKQVSFDLNRVDFNPPGRSRTRKGRANVPMTPTLRDALQQANSARQSEHVVEWASGPVKSIKKGFAEACRRAGLVGVTPHTLRHTAATWMAEAGVPMRQISLCLGHTSTAVTERVYAKHTPDYLKDAMAALDPAQCSVVQSEPHPVNESGNHSRKSAGSSPKTR